MVGTVLILSIIVMVILLLGIWYGRNEQQIYKQKEKMS